MEVVQAEMNPFSCLVIDFCPRLVVIVFENCIRQVVYRQSACHRILHNRSVPVHALRGAKRRMYFWIRIERLYRFKTTVFHSTHGVVTVLYDLPVRIDSGGQKMGVQTVL